MALQKQALNLNFAQGLDLKTDDKQVAPGKFLILENSVFTKGNLLKKRNGYGSLSDLPNAETINLTTFNGNLTALGTDLLAYSASNEQWVNQGPIKPLRLSTLPLLRSNTNQSQADAAIASNGLVCTVFTDDVPVDGVIVPIYKYVVADSVTGQNIVAPAVITPAAGVVEGSPRVFALGRYFVIVFTNNVSGTYHLAYIAVNIVNPTQVTASVSLSAQYDPAPTVAFDGVVMNNSLYLVWNGSDVGGAIRATRIDAFLNQYITTTFPGRVATMFAVSHTMTNNQVYVSFYDSVSQDGYTLILDQSLNTILAPTQIINNEDVLNLASASTTNLGANIVYEIDNNYGYDAAIPTHYLRKVYITMAGVVTGPITFARSVGLASKGFVIDSIMYFMAVYSSENQPSYFLMNLDGEVVSKLAYSNGSGYYPVGLPSVSVSDNIASIAYFFKDLIQSVNKTQDSVVSAGIYSQLGINLASFTIGGVPMVPAEIANDLHLSGGFLWIYDGYRPVEHGFFVWPDNVEASAVTDPTPTGDVSTGSDQVLNISSMTGIVVGMIIAGTNIPVSTTVIAVNVGASSLTMSANATGTLATTALTFTGSVTVQDYFYYATYEWSDNQGNNFRSAPSIPITVTAGAGESSIEINVPTLRLTYKLDNPVKIVIYRASVAQNIPYQVTSIQIPILNNPLIDYITYTDLLSDAQIIGNNILYTFGSVLENISAPSLDSITLFQSRLFGIDAENKDNLWFSKQVIPTVPVEMSDLLTMFIAPTAGAQGSTGPMKALAALDDKLIIFKRNAIYYISGQGPDNTGANNQYSEPVFITATVGSENQQSIVFMPSGLMFQSDKGIWLLGRDLSTQYIGAPVESLTQDAIVQSAVNVPGTNQVRFTLDSGITLMYDYYYGQWGTFVNVPAISSTLYENLHTYVNEHGRVFQESPGLYLDGSNPVLMKFTTSWLNLAGLQGFERAYFFYLLGTYFSPHKLCVQVAYDYNPSPTQTSMIVPDNATPPWGGKQLWGSNGGWGGPGSLEQHRVFMQQQKCQAFQITICENFDYSAGGTAGQGLTLSGLDILVGMKSQYPRLRAVKSVG